MEILHKCSKSRTGYGILILDLRDIYRFITPSFVVKSDGVTPGVMDIVEIAGNNLSYCCKSCGKTFCTDDLDSMLARCTICGKVHKIEEIMSNAHMSSVCNVCVARLKNNDIVTQEIRSFMMLYPEVAYTAQFFPISNSIFTLKENKR